MLGRLGIFLILSLFISVSRAEINDSAKKDCLDEAVYRKEVNSSFKFLTQDRKMPFRNCDPENIYTKVARAILWLKENNTRASTSAVLKSKLLESGPFEYFRKHVGTLVFHPSKGSCAETTQIFAYVVIGEGRVIHICPRLAKMTMHQIASTLIHEARHVDGPRHVTCANGQLKGRAGLCDSSLEQEGSYGAEVEFLNRLSRDEKINAAVRAAAKSEILANLFMRYNKRPLKIRSMALLQKDNGELSLIDGSSRTQMSGPSIGYSPRQVLSDRWGQPSLFDPDRNETLSYAFSKGWVQTLGTIAQRYREEFSQTERSEFQDVIYSNISDFDHGCILFRAMLECQENKTDGRKVSIPLPSATAKGFVRSAWNDWNSKSLHHPLHLKTTDGLYYQIPIKFAQLEKAKELRNLKITKVTADVAGIGWWSEGSELILNTDGEVQVYSLKTKTLSPLPELKGERFKKILSPFYWSPLLEEL